MDCRRAVGSHDGWSLSEELNGSLMLCYEQRMKVLCSRTLCSDKAVIIGAPGCEAAIWI